MIEAGDIVERHDCPGRFYRCYKIQNDLGHFYRVRKNGMKDRREKGFTGPMQLWRLVQKCEFPGDGHCKKCGKESTLLVNQRCPKCNPFRACTTQGCLGDFQSIPTPNWMNRFVCDTCGIEVSR